MSNFLLKLFNPYAKPHTINLRRNTRRRLVMLLFQALITYVISAINVGIQQIEKNKKSSLQTNLIIFFISIPPNRGISYAQG